MQNVKYLGLIETCKVELLIMVGILFIGQTCRITKWCDMI